MQNAGIDSQAAHELRPAQMSNGPARSAAPRRILKRILLRLVQAIACLVALFGVACAVTSYRYNVSFSAAARDIAKEASLKGIALFVSVYDPSTTIQAKLGPDDEGSLSVADYARIDDVFAAAQTKKTPNGGQITLLECRNERIIRSVRPFGYQPHDEPRLAELRTRYGLDAIVAAAPTEFDAMVDLRRWARSRFLRSDYQPKLQAFDALEILDRNHRGNGEPISADEHYDPCLFYPLFYCQVLASVGHQARFLDSGGHGMTDVWSNQYRKWVLMDAELDHHFVKDGVPLSAVELLEESCTGKPPTVSIVRGKRPPGQENPTAAHLKVEQLDIDSWITMFHSHLTVSDLRNDWMTNHYFPGHPMRSEQNSIVYVDSRVTKPIPFEERHRPQTRSKDEFYWTLNQAEILVHDGNDETLQLAFRTVMPNFDHFEIVVDDQEPFKSSVSTFAWRLHEGVNTLTVRPINQFGVRGIESRIKLALAPKS